jgi:hypothetical protein
VSLLCLSVGCKGCVLYRAALFVFAVSGCVMLTVMCGVLRMSVVRNSVIPHTTATVNHEVSRG